MNKSINVEKLIEILIKQDEEIKKLKESEGHLKGMLQIQEKEFEVKKGSMKRQLELEA